MDRKEAHKKRHKTSNTGASKWIGCMSRNWIGEGEDQDEETAQNIT